MIHIINGIEVIFDANFEIGEIIQTGDGEKYVYRGEGRWSPYKLGKEILFSSMPPNSQEEVLEYFRNGQNKRQS